MLPQGALRHLEAGPDVCRPPGLAQLSLAAGRYAHVGFQAARQWWTVRWRDLQRDFYRPLDRREIHDTDSERNGLVGEIGELLRARLLDEHAVRHPFDDL